MLTKATQSWLNSFDRHEAVGVQLMSALRLPLPVYNSCLVLSPVVSTSLNLVARWRVACLVYGCVVSDRVLSFILPCVFLRSEMCRAMRYKRREVRDLRPRLKPRGKVE